MNIIILFCFCCVCMYIVIIFLFYACITASLESDTESNSLRRACSLSDLSVPGYENHNIQGIAKNNMQLIIFVKLLYLLKIKCHYCFCRKNVNQLTSQPIQYWYHLILRIFWLMLWLDIIKLFTIIKLSQSILQNLNVQILNLNLDPHLLFSSFRFEFGFRIFPQN